MADHELRFRLPVKGCPEVVFETNYSYAGGRLLMGEEELLVVASRQELRDGASCCFHDTDEVLFIELISDSVNRAYLVMTLGGRKALTEKELTLHPSRSTWIEASLALLASVFGLWASYRYLALFQQTGEAWPLKMACHMAGWHLLLVLTLFPAVAWGQRIGIRTAQVVSGLFALIHLGIALANFFSMGEKVDTPGIAFFNAASGILFLAALVYGARAHSDMDPVAALVATFE
jgi:hypothetical protein